MLLVTIIIIIIIIIITRVSPRFAQAPATEHTSNLHYRVLSSEDRDSLRHYRH